MSTSDKDTSAQVPTNADNQMDKTPTYVQPESGAESDAQAEQKIRQSSPTNPRVANKPMEATEEA